MQIIDGHIHIFKKIKGKNGNGKIGKASFTIEELKKLMSENKVDKAVIVQNPTIGSVNEEIDQAIKCDPDRFAGAIQVDPRYDKGAYMIHKLSQNKGFRAIKLEMSFGWGWTGIYRDLTYDDESIHAIIKSASDNGLHVIIDPGPIGNPGYDLDGLCALIDQFPNTVFQIEHLGYRLPENDQNPADIEIWNRCIELGLKKNVYIGYSAVGSLLEEEYPCEKALKLLEYAVLRIGEDKIIWGTDAPTSLKKFTYKQMIDSVIKHSSLGEVQKAAIMGLNAEKLYFGR